MPTFVPGTGALSLRNDIKTIAVNNGCSEGVYTDISLYDMDINAYQMGSTPSGMGEFYGQGCPAILDVYANFYADPYSDSPASWGIWYKVGTTGTETLICSGDQIGISPTCTGAFTVNIATKDGIGQSGNDIYVGVRTQGKSVLSGYYDAQGSGGCPDTNNGTYIGTYDYACGAVYNAIGTSGAIMSVFITISVDKAGYVIAC